MIHPPKNVTVLPARSEIACWYCPDRLRDSTCYSQQLGRPKVHLKVGPVPLVLHLSRIWKNLLWTAALTCFNFPTCRWRWTGTWWFVENGWDDGNILPFKEHDCVRTCHQSTWACARQDSNYRGMWMDVGHSDQHTTRRLDLHKQKLLPGLRHPRTQSEAPPPSSPMPRWTVETTNPA